MLKCITLCSPNKYTLQTEAFHSGTKFMNCLSLIRYISKANHMHIQQNYSHKTAQCNTVFRVSTGRGLENGYIYYLDFSSLEHHLVHTKTPATNSILPQATCN